VDKKENNNILLTIENIFKEVFSKKEITLSYNTRVHDIKTWDSLNHISLILALEHSFNIKFSTREIIKIRELDYTIGNLIEHINGKSRNG